MLSNIILLMGGWHMLRAILYLGAVVILSSNLVSAAKANYYSIKFQCKDHKEFMESKSVVDGRFRWDRFYPYVMSSLNIYGDLRGREKSKVGPFDYSEEWGHYFNRHLILIKPNPIENSPKYEYFSDDKCPSRELDYLRSIFSERDNLHMSLLVIEKSIKGDGPGRAIFGALLGVAIKASTAGIIDINHEIIEFIELAEGEINILGHSIEEIYNPNNNLRKRNLKTIPLSADLERYTIDDGTLFDIPLNVQKIHSMEDVSSLFPDRGTLFENVKFYMHLDVEPLLQDFFNKKLSKDLFDGSWETFKNDDKRKQLADQCESLRERIEIELSLLTKSDQAIALAEFVNAQGLENPHLKSFCLGDRWLKAAKESDFGEELATEVSNSNENPFANSVSPGGSGAAGSTNTDLRKVWLEEENVQSRLSWIIRALKIASSGGDGAVNDIANSATRYASEPVELRDTTGSLRDTVLGTEVPLDDLMYLVSGAAKERGQQIQVLGCYLNYRQLNDGEIADEDWHWQLFGKWGREELQESDYFLVRVKFDNSKRSADGGADFAGLAFLNISESSLYDIAGVHKERGVPLKETTCGKSNHPIGSVYAQLY